MYVEVVLVQNIHMTYLRLKQLSSAQILRQSASVKSNLNTISIRSHTCLEIIFPVNLKVEHVEVQDPNIKCL